MIATKTSVLVLLPVFNGAMFLSAQIDSILAQHGVHTMLLCRDDGSSDESVAILADYQERFPENLFLLQDMRGNLGAGGNFSLLMQSALKFPRAWDFVAMADQDDIWYPDKLSRGVVAMRATYAAESDMPVLVHSDMRVVDRDLVELSASLVDYQGLQPERRHLSWQLLSNSVTGCSVLANRRLLEQALPVPPQAVMHDWWLALVASALGRRIWLDEVLQDYRQHDSNTLGARQWRAGQFDASLFERLRDQRSRELLTNVAQQAAVFGQRFRRDLGPRQRLAVWFAAGLDRRSTVVQKLLFRLLRHLPL